MRTLDFMADDIPAPHNDTITSIVAAETIETITGHLRRLIYRYLRSLSDGATHRELELALGIRGDTIRPRCRELEKLGLIRDTGRTRLNPGSRLPSIVWEAV